MNEIVTVDGGQVITTTLAIASGTEVDHASVIKLVRAYQSDLEEFGLLDFKSESTGGRPTELALFGHAFTEVKFTPKGVNWVAGEWGKHQIQSEVA